VVRPSVIVNQAEDELRRREVTRNANDHAFNGPVPLYLNPAIGPTRCVGSIRTFGHHSFDRWKRQPLARHGDVVGLRDQL
jgi:hypothetical protein